jgi:hypothetical protein
MKNYKIVETSSKFPDVLLYRDRNEHGDESVVIFAIGENTIETNTDYFTSEVVNFDTIETAQSFITHFNSDQASEWCKRQNINYY